MTLGSWTMCFLPNVYVMRVHGEEFAMRKYSIKNKFGKTPNANMQYKYTIYISTARTPIEYLTFLRFTSFLLHSIMRKVSDGYRIDYYDALLFSEWR